MNKLLTAVKSCKGSTMIIMAFAMTTVMALGALIFDIGNVMVERQKLQNAVDSACLAAAMELPDTVKAEEKARYYSQANGVDPKDITIKFLDSNNTIDITANKKVDYFLARVLGLESTNTAANAAASSDSIGGAFNYTLFSGSTTERLGLFGSNIAVTGSVHANKNLFFSASNITISGPCEAATTIEIYGGNIDVKDRRPNSSYVEMPDFSETVKQQAQAAGRYYVGNKVFSGSSLNFDSPIYVEGNVTIATSNFTGKGCIAATGNITVGVSNLNADADAAACFYSVNGDILLSASNIDITGYYYAPNGKIGSYASNLKVRGKVIGNVLQFSASNVDVVDDGAMMGSLPSKGIRLIR